MGCKARWKVASIATSSNVARDAIPTLGVGRQAPLALPPASLPLHPRATHASKQYSKHGIYGPSATQYARKCSECRSVKFARYAR